MDDNDRRMPRPPARERGVSVTLYLPVSRFDELSSAAAAARKPISRYLREIVVFQLAPRASRKPEP